MTNEILLGSGSGGGTHTTPKGIKPFDPALLAFNPGKAEKTEDPVDREISEFYQKVILDGRFITDLDVNPTTVAERLKVKVSQRALDRITARPGFRLTQPGGVVASPVRILISVAVAVVVVVASKDDDLPVNDRSSAVKL
jgi:hypothetical protein